MTIEDKHLLELVKRSGILETMQREAEEERASGFEAARQRKKTAVDHFRVERPKAQARVDAAEEKCQTARRAFEATVAELGKAAQARDQVEDTFTALRGELDAVLRKHSDPRVDAMVAELQQIRRNENGELKRNSHEELSATLRQISELIDEVHNRIRIGGEGGDITDIGAALDEVRTRIPSRNTP